MVEEQTFVVAHAYHVVAIVLTAFAAATACAQRMRINHRGQIVGAYIDVGGADPVFFCWA